MESGNSVDMDINVLAPSRKEKGRTVIGEKYALINKISRDEAEELFAETGIRITFSENEYTTKVLIGSVNFGKLRIAQHLEGKFVAVKKIKGFNEIQQSKNEGALQAKLEGKSNIMPILDFVESTSSQKMPVLYQFMPLAGFGNGSRLRSCLQKVSPYLREQIIVHVAQSLATGLKNMHQSGIYHLDLKPANFVLDKVGELFIIDFGCAKELSDGVLREEGLGDSRYFSPERLSFIKILYHHQTPYPILAEKVDAWALGVTLLELLSGSYPFNFLVSVEALQQEAIVDRAEDLNYGDVYTRMYGSSPVYGNR